MNSLFKFVSVYKNIKMLIINYHYRNSDELLDILPIYSQLFDMFNRQPRNCAPVRIIS